MLSGSENGFVYVWDMVEGGLVAMLKHDEGATEALPSTLAVHSLAAHPSKVALLTAAKTREEAWAIQHAFYFMKMQNLKFIQRLVHQTSRTLYFEVWNWK